MIFEEQIRVEKEHYRVLFVVVPRRVWVIIKRRIKMGEDQYPNRKLLDRKVGAIDLNEKGEGVDDRDYKKCTDTLFE